MEQKNLYIPGDLVKYNNDLGKVTEIGTSDWYDGAYTCKLRFFSSHNYFTVGQCDIEPIPLTPEILEANGWEFTECHRDEDGFEWYVFSNDRVSLDLHYYPQCKGFSVFACGEEILPGIKYLHQLQHLLFGLELESNMIV